MTDSTLSLELLLQQFPIIKYTVFGVVACCGSVTRFLWDCLRGSTAFTIWGILLYVFFGFFIGNLTGGFLGLDHEHRDFYLLLSGFVVGELFTLLQSNGGSLIGKVLRLPPKDAKEKEETTDK